MKFIVTIIILVIISAFTYIKLNPIEAIKPYKEIVLKKTAIINKPIIQKKVLPKSKPIQRKVPSKPKLMRKKTLPKSTSPRLKKTYRCDRRVYCSQMHSCEEAKFFIRNCRGTKMDGNGDSIPCERQWCH